MMPRRTGGERLAPMPTPGEKKAMAFLAGLLLLGSGVRGARAFGDAKAVSTEERTALRNQIAAVDSAREASKAGRKRNAKPAGPVAPVDLDRATVEEMQQVKGIGPVLAARIVANRDSLGAFGSMEGLRAVPGVGPRTADKLAPQVTFSGPRRPQRVEAGGPARGARARADPGARRSDSTTGRSTRRGSPRRAMRSSTAAIPDLHLWPLPSLLLESASVSSSSARG